MVCNSFLTLFVLGLVNFANCETIVAEAILQDGTINGTILFTESEQGIHVTGIITGLPVGLYGFHIHEIGNVTTCDAAGAHFNPEEVNHGDRDHPVRHVGDLGNVQFVNAVGGTSISFVNFVDSVISFNGTNNILGRTLVLHEQEDDLGLGGHETSLTTGNAGARVACGIIREVEADNAVGSMAPSLTALALAMVYMIVSL